MRRGFTLVELLIVIAVIGVLSAVVLSALNQARVKARMTQRSQDLHMLQKVVEMYYTQNGVYPSTGGSYWYDCYVDNTRYNSYVPNVVSAGLISKLPHDPASRCVGNRDYNYAYRSTGTTYSLMVQVPNQSGGLENCSSGSAYGFVATCGTDPMWELSGP